ncbi:MAG: replication and repair protein RecF, partial [Actinomycetota bacterium]|nr:replication and repair protein RecF [Actinomycetota bacterium]
ARTHASQGEQRSLALALRLAGHRVVGETLGEPPVLLLDDVFSELDDLRSQALLDHLPPGQAILTTTGAIPPGAEPGMVVEVTAAHLAFRRRPQLEPDVPPIGSAVFVAQGAAGAPDATQTEAERTERPA